MVGQGPESISDREHSEYFADCSSNSLDSSKFTISTVTATVDGAIADFIIARLSTSRLKSHGQVTVEVIVDGVMPKIQDLLLEWQELGLYQGLDPHK